MELRLFLGYVRFFLGLFRKYLYTKTDVTQSTSEDIYSNRQTSGTPERAQALLGICMALLRICMALFVLSKALLQIYVHNDRRYQGHERGK